MIGFLKTPSPKTLPEILSGFHTALRDLRAFSSEKNERAQEIAERIDTLAEERGECLTEKAKADAVTKNLETLLAGA